MPCSNCQRDVKLAGRGLCSACYCRLRRRGTVSRKYVVNTGKCSVDGCENRGFSKNLCSFHYQKMQGPVKSSWKHIRTAYPDEYPQEWEDFEVFRSVVGEKPTPNHQLRRKDPSLPWSNENIRWLEPISAKDRGEKWSVENRPAYIREWVLRKKYNIGADDYDALLKKQNGVCAICKQPETYKGNRGRQKVLSVDHCHTTGKIRGLLCVRCNKGVGYFCDDTKLMQSAINYLRQK